MKKREKEKNTSLYQLKRKNQFCRQQGLQLMFFV